MVGLKDLTTLLEKWPTWKRVVETPDRVDKLEERLAKLEKLIEKRPGDTCPTCGEHAMRLSKDWGLKGTYPNRVRREDWTCEKCAYVQQRDVPSTA